MSVQEKIIEKVVVRFAGDSGDGMQLAGGRFAADTALQRCDLRTMPDFPAEIRAPAGSLAGVSSFQIHFASSPIDTPGDFVDVLVVMNPAALKMDLSSLRKTGILIVNKGQFTAKNFAKAGYPSNPLEDGSLDAYEVHAIDISVLTENSIADLGLAPRTVARCNNFFALGMVLWLYNREIDVTLSWIDSQFTKDTTIRDANKRCLAAGFALGETAEWAQTRFRVPASHLPEGIYRSLTGNQALSLGLVVAGRKAGLDVFLGAYPITPASDILHTMAKMSAAGVITFQAEDEIASIAAALGASYGGALGVTVSSGPGISLKAEAMGLAVMAELPLVILNIQRAGPSTGMPTKTEQADLFQALHGRSGEAPVPVLAAASPADCFDTAIEAARIAIKYRTPVIVLSDAFLANGSEPWHVPSPDHIAPIDPHFCTSPEGFAPYKRDPGSLARPWVRLGTPGLEHRIGGLEKADITGEISYDPDNHERMVMLRAEKINGVKREYGPLELYGDPDAKTLILGWGSTRGAIHGAVSELCAKGTPVAGLHVRHMFPLHAELLPVLNRFESVWVPELNLGQFGYVLRAHGASHVRSLCQIRGLHFRVTDLVQRIEQTLREVQHGN